MFGRIVKKLKSEATDEEKAWQEKCSKIWGDAKVLIGIPNNGAVDDLPGESPFKSFLQLAMFFTSQKESQNWAIQPIARMITHEARNALARQAVEEGYTHLMMIDSDQTFEKDIIHQLLLFEKYIIGVRAYKRTSPHYPCIFAKKKDEPMENGMIFADVCDQGVMVADAIGFGAVLIRTEVFKKMTYPYFFFNRFGEDFNFCSQAQAAGFKIHVNTDIEIGHVSQTVIRRKDYLRELEDGTIADYDKNMVKLIGKQNENKNVDFTKIKN